MPFTVSHAAAALPFRKLCPRFLNFAGLVIGSMTPDAGYFVGLWKMSSFAHTLLGSVVADVPIGLFLFFIFYALRRSFCHLLPSPHREACLEACDGSPFPKGAGGLLVLAVSLLVGAWTHILWDGFTHGGGWLSWWTFFERTNLKIAGRPFKIYGLLQYLSSVFGLFCLWIAYRRRLKKYLRKNKERKPKQIGKFAFLFLLLSAPVAPAIRMAWKFRKYEYDFVFHSIVNYISVLGILVFMAILVVTIRRSLFVVRTDQKT